MDRIARALAALTGWRRLAVALAAGGVSALALPPVSAVPILFATLPVFVWLLDGAADGTATARTRRFRGGAAIGWCFGFGYFVAGLWWIGAAFLVDGEQFAWLLPIAVTVLPAGLALFWGLGAGMATLAWRQGWPRILVLAAAMAAAEWLRGHLLTGFPWNAFGYALAPVTVLMQSAALVGLWGLTLAAFLIFAAPAALAPRPAAGRWGGIGFAVFALVLLGAHAGYGALRLAGAEDDGSGPALRIVQPSIEQSERWQAANEDEIVARYLRLSAGPHADGSGRDGATLLIWPESAFPFLLSERPDVLAAIADLLPEGTTLLTGAVRADNPADPFGDAYNSVLLIDDTGTIVAAYDKVHLVPFGEYLPFRALLGTIGLRQLVALPEGFVPGAARMMLSVPGAPPVAPLICYEIIFPGAALPSGPRPGWILNLTNDAWFGATPGPYQHLLQSRLRAVETGLPVIRAANSGISAIIDAYGNVQKSLPLEAVGTIDGSLPPVAPSTVYTQFGDVFFLALLLICVAIGGIAAHHRSVRQN